MQQKRQRRHYVEEEKHGVSDRHESLSGCPSIPSVQLHVCGDKLDRLLGILGSALKKDIAEPFESMPNKRFMRKCKAFCCIGVNNVTRTLERMPRLSNEFDLSIKGDDKAKTASNSERHRKARRTSLQVVMVAVDVHPRALVGHFTELAASRNVPLITLSGGNGIGSLRLGELFHLRTAIAVGLKAGTSESNKAMGSFLKPYGLKMNAD